jgi:UDP-N-acetylglucosamine--N-acetylmuramyl-(pentapeptide) pyrophosphoryl-undecaprenol N-acetylglucosamine transferase
MHKNKHHKYIILAGGLSGGPVTPLLAVTKEWQKHDPDIEPVLVDIRKSTSAIIAEDRKILFKSIITGKFRRYFAWQNFFAPLLLLIGLVQSFLLLRKFKPVAVLGAGGFVQIPLIIAAWVLRIPRFIHQQDVVPTLSNQLCSMLANLVTTTFEFSIRDFLQGTGLGKKYITTDKVIWTGNPILMTDSEVTKTQAMKEFHLYNDLPVLLVVGGATGSQSLNELIVNSLPELTRVVQVIHNTGPYKYQKIKQSNYQSYPYMENMDVAYKAADVVLSRAGISTLTELALHGKASIIVPMPDTHQEFNADLLYRTKSAIVLDQSELDAELLIKTIRKILFDSNLQKNLQKNFKELFPKNAANKIYHLINNFIKESHVKK